MLQVGLFWQFEGVSNGVLLGGLERIIGSQRRGLAELVAHLGEVEARRLHLDLGYPSMFAYCTDRLRMSEDEAYRRIVVARLGRRVPIVLQHLASGALSLSVAALLKPHEHAPNLEELIEALLGKSVKAAREVLAAYFPQPDVPSTLRKVPQRQRTTPPNAAACTPSEQRQRTPHHPEFPLRGQPAASPPPGKVELPSPPRHDPPASPVRCPHPIEPLAAGRYKVQFTADAALKEKLELARDLLRHTIPSGDLALLLDRALDLLIEAHMKRRFGTLTNRATARSRSKCPNAAPAAPHPASAEPDAIGASLPIAEPPLQEPNKGSDATDVDRATRRSVLERDGLRCTWQGEDGVRCGARAWLEHDHRHPRGRGGRSTVENVRHLCRAHNQRAAEIAYGQEHIARAVAIARARRDGARSRDPG